MSVDDYQCEVCGTVVEVWHDRPAKPSRHMHYCEVCGKVTRHTKLIGGHPDKTSASKWRRDK
jgi:uncharacterized Zn finger protein